jgi:Glyoxalase-like domain
VSEAAPAVAGFGNLAFDCAEPRVVAAFWHAVLGGDLEVDSDGDGDGDATLRPPGGGRPWLDFLRVPDPKTAKNRLHMDLRSTDHDAAVEQVLALGATRAPDVYDGDGWTVLRDPEGNEFCILRPPSRLQP